jgi:hypothetical protein
MAKDSSLHFVPLRMTVICVFEEGVVGGHASNHPLLPATTLNVCHSERSEESHTFNRTLMIIKRETFRKFTKTVPESIHFLFKEKS